MCFPIICVSFLLNHNFIHLPLSCFSHYRKLDIVWCFFPPLYLNLLSLHWNYHWKYLSWSLCSVGFYKTCLSLTLVCVMNAPVYQLLWTVAWGKTRMSKREIVKESQANIWTPSQNKTFNHVLNAPINHKLWQINDYPYR